MFRRNSKIIAENKKLREIIKNQDDIIYNQNRIIHKLLEKQLKLTLNKARDYKKSDFMYLEY